MCLLGAQFLFVVGKWHIKKVSSLLLDVKSHTTYGRVRKEEELGGHSDGRVGRPRWWERWEATVMGELGCHSDGKVGMPQWDTVGFHHQRARAFTIWLAQLFIACHWANWALDFTHPLPLHPPQYHLASLYILHQQYRGSLICCWEFSSSDGNANM